MSVKVLSHPGHLDLDLEDFSDPTEITVHFIRSGGKLILIFMSKQLSYYY